MKKNKLTRFLVIASSMMLLTGCDADALFGLGGKVNEITDWAKSLFAKQEMEKVEYNSEGYTMKELESEKVTVTFFKNIGKEELDLNSGMYATTTTTALKIDQIDKGSKATRPETDPLRQNYEFDGWHTSQSENSPYDFDLVVNSNLVLYAHWTQTQEELFVEPEYVEPSHIDDSIDTLVSIYGVLNMEVSAGKVQLSNSALARLNRRPSDVTDILNYKIKTGVTLTATYDEDSKTISYTASKEGESDQVGTIIAQNNSLNLKLDNGTYETKAANYETRDVEIEDHRIMLAGSSSMENWSHSGEDLQPLTTYNHGIGGTTVEQWKDKLNQRLVYPYSPKIVVYYVGVNNIINTGSSQEDTANWLTEMFDDVHEHLPNTHIYYVLINELPNYRNKQAQFDFVNNAAKAYEAEHSYVTTLNAGQGLLKANGEPNQAYFLLDGLHMSLAGYAIWGKFIKDKLISDLRNNA